jgi:hypothetical protein
MNKAFLVFFDIGEYDSYPANICIVSSIEKFHQICEDLKQAIREKKPNFFIGSEEYIWLPHCGAFVGKDYSIHLLIEHLDCVELSFIQD